jgi:hypothetical protein
MVRAKFVCNSVTKSKAWNGDGFLYGAEFSPVCSGSEENKKFFASTPNGKISLTSILPDAFVPGQEYYIDFVPVPA